MASRLALLAVALSFVATTISPVAQAQSIRDRVKDQVDEGLEESEKKKKKKKESKKKRDKKKSKKRDKQKERDKKKKSKKKRKKKKRASKDQSNSASVKIGADGVERSPTEPDLPKRVFGENFEFDPQAGIGYRGWMPDQYPGMEIKTQSYLQWYVGFNAKIYKKLKIYRAFYKSTGFKSPRPTGAVIAQKATKAAPGAATKAMAMMGYDVRFVLVPMFRYEARSYEATATPNQPVRIVPFDTDPDFDPDDLPQTTDPLYAASTFETFIIGMRYNDKLKPKNGKKKKNVLPYYFGAGFTRFGKPYQLRVGDSVDTELLYNGKFRGAGLALGFDLPGGINKIGLNFASQVGLGEIRVLEDLTINEVLSNGWLIGYVQGDLTVDYTVPILKTRPTLLFSPVASIGGNSFFYFNTKGEGGDAPLANWDLLWQAMGRFIVTL